MAEQQRSVIGFSGLPVRNGAGIRLPVVHDPASDSFSVLGRRMGAVPRSEFDGYVEQGLATRLPIRRPEREDGLVLYVHDGFVRPEGGFPTLVDLMSGPVASHGDGFLYGSYLPRAECLHIFRRWARRLVEDAQEHLEHSRSPEDWRRALNSSLRARFCALPEVDLELRFEAFLWLAVARDLLGMPMRPVFQDAALDFPNEQQCALKEKALDKTLQICSRRKPPHELVDCPVFLHGTTLPRFEQDLG